GPCCVMSGTIDPQYREQASILSSNRQIMKAPNVVPKIPIRQKCNGFLNNVIRREELITSNSDAVIAGACCRPTVSRINDADPAPRIDENLRQDLSKPYMYSSWFTDPSSTPSESVIMPIRARRGFSSESSSGRCFLARMYSATASRITCETE